MPSGLQRQEAGHLGRLLTVVSHCGLLTCCQPRNQTRQRSPFQISLPRLGPAERPSKKPSCSRLQLGSKYPASKEMGRAKAPADLAATFATCIPGRCLFLPVVTVVTQRPHPSQLPSHFCRLVTSVADRAGKQSPTKILTVSCQDLTAPSGALPA